MDINRLNEFIVLATHLNYSKAANQLFLTQPALSRHIHDLEETLGAKLFIRDTHNVHLTPVGKIFFQEACEIIEKYEHALEVVKDSISYTTGEIKLGFLSAAIKPFLSSFCSYYNDIHPEVKLSFCAGDLDPLLELLNNNELDCIFASNAGIQQMPDYMSETLLTCGMVLVTTPDNHLADRDSVTFKDLDNEPMVFFSKKSSPITHDFNMSLFKKNGVHCNIVQEVPNVETGLFYTSLGVGSFLLPDHCSDLAKDLVCVPVEGDIASVELILLWKKDNSNITLPSFQKEFAEFFRNPSEE
ncbi:MAG: LysR family transcriptional regulator [Emergencia sp.]